MHFVFMYEKRAMKLVERKGRGDKGELYKGESN
jgi:hypothetical protein